jgi:GDPmannose 4,6-dehydratase
MKKILITGITGQDGSYLSRHLLELNYEVHGVVRRLSVSENQTSRLEDLKNDVHLHYGDLLDGQGLFNIINKVKPSEIYNLAAMSHVGISAEIPFFTLQTNGLAVVNILEIIKNSFPKIKFYQASSSEMFGNSIDNDKYQRLSTVMSPVSVYGCSKLLAFNLVRHYRTAYKLDLRNGILFNHESSLRGSNFVTSKIIKTAVEIKKGLKNNLFLGNLDSYRDWGHAKDYVRAMKMIMDYDEARDWIVSTGFSRSVREMCDYVFKKIGLNYKDFVIQDPKFIRSEELNFLRGDSSEIRNILGWKPEISFEELIDEMLNFWLKKIL